MNAVGDRFHLCVASDIKLIVKNPVIIITGAGKGIGKSIAEEIAKRAPSLETPPALFLVSRSSEDLNALQAHCSPFGLKTHAFTGDIAKPEDNSRIVSTCLEKFGPITCLINNAGVGRFAPFSDLTLEDLDYVLATNVRGTFDLTQKVFKQMEASRFGHLVFVTSISAEKAFEASAAYCMSKFAQKGLIEVLRLYGYRLNIRITHVMPGAVNTPMWGEAPAEQRAKMIDPAEVAKLIADAVFSSPHSSVEEIVIRPTAGDILI